MMYNIIGIKKPHYNYDPLKYEVIVAKFTDEHLATEYLKKSKLSTFRSTCTQYQHERQFRKKSLLYDYCDAYIEIDDDYEAPINPTL